MTDKDVEITLLSKGVGECIILNIPGYGWIVIDSFELNRRPVAETYLGDKGVDFADVRIILLTHWHDDHIRGASTFIKKCPNAKVAIPLTLKRDEFWQFIKRNGKEVDGTFTSGVDELYKILCYLTEFEKRPTYALANRVLDEGDNFYIECLSPSDADVDNFLSDLARWMEEGVSNARIPCPNRNDSSVATVVMCGEALALFGADLEVTTPESGWEKVCDEAWRSRGQAAYIKVPHHGSPNAHHDPLWNEKLVKDCTATIAPYARGRRKLPHDDDILRLQNWTKEIYVGCSGTLTRARHPSNTVERTLREANIKIKNKISQSGTITSKYLNGDHVWETSFYGSAQKV